MDHTTRELQVFRLFLDARGIAASPDAVSKRDPPEPDLLFRHPDDSVIAYELVELLDEDWARTLGEGKAIVRLSKTHLESLPADVQARFKKKYQNAQLSYTFSGNSTSRQKLRAIPRIFGKLLELPDDLVGVTVQRDPELLGVLDCMTVHRGDYDVGPIFNPGGFAWVCDPTVPLIKQKFAKKYKSPHPVELLAYIAGNPMFPPTAWREPLDQYLAAPDRFQFQKIWVLDCNRAEICFTYP